MFNKPNEYHYSGDILNLASAFSNPIPKSIAKSGSVANSVDNDGFL